MEIYDQRCPICKCNGNHRQIVSGLWQNKECKDVFHRDEYGDWEA